MKTQTKSRALLLVCVLLLVTALVAVFAFSASAADVTELTNYSLVLNDGVDIKVNGTVAEADLEKEIKVVATCFDETTYDVTVEDGAFSVVIPVSVTRYADAVKVDLYVDDEIVATEDVSIKANVAALLADEEISVAVKTLASEVIRYGAAALTYLGYTEEAEAFAADLALAEPIAPEWEPDFSYDKGETAEIAINNVSMELAERINLIFTADASVDGYTVEAGSYDVEVEGNTIKVVGIPISAFFTPFTVGVYDGEDAVSNEVTISPLTYIMLYQESLDPENMDEADLAAAEADMDLLYALTLYAAAAHEATDHEMVLVSSTAATCSADGVNVTACAGCGATEEEIIPMDAAVHSELTYTVADGQITYTCAGCEASWTSTTMALADGTSTSKMEGNSSNAGFVGCTDNKPAMVDGHYEFVKAETPASSQAQFYLASGKSSAAVANRLGFVSISLTAVDVPLGNGVAGWALKLCNSSGGWNTIKGQAKGMDILVGDPTDGSVVLTMGGVEIALAADAYTRIDISFVPVENDMYLLTYYADGVAVDVVTVDNILKNYTPDKLYFTCGGVAYTEDVDVQPTVKFDDLTLAFTDNTADEFFPKNHVHTADEEAVQIDGETHAFMCTGCDVTVTVVKHTYDFSGATCASGVATGTCVCGATTTKTIEHTLVATGIADNVVTYQCSVCESEYTMAVARGDDFSGVTPVWDVADEKSATIVDGALFMCATESGASNGNAIISPAAKGVITGTDKMIIGFDLKNTDNRGGNAKDFIIQWRVPGTTGGNWAFDGTTKLYVKPDGSVCFDNAQDTGIDISKTEFTSFVLAATLTDDGAKTTITIDLWINGQYVGATTKTVDGVGASFQNNGAYPQVCLQNNGGANEMYYDNLYIADVPAGAEGTNFLNYVTAK